MSIKSVTVALVAASSALGASSDNHVPGECTPDNYGKLFDVTGFVEKVPEVDEVPAEVGVGKVVERRSVGIRGAMLIKADDSLCCFQTNFAAPANGLYYCFKSIEGIQQVGLKLEACGTNFGVLERVHPKRRVCPL